jgi:uncharacterized protein
MSPATPTATLLVDGYNIIGLWSELQKIREFEGLEPARRALAEQLVGYTIFRNLDAYIVFDSQYRNSKGNRETIAKNLVVIYTDFGQTADTYIEKTCAAFSREARCLRRRTIVATSDRAQQLTVVGYGAEWMSAQQLAAEVRATDRDVRRFQKSSPVRSNQRFLSKSLDPAAQERLDKLRKGLL